MFATDDLFPPAQYAWGWLILAFAVILIAILVGFAILQLTKPQTSIDGPSPDVPLTSAEVIGRMQQEYLGTINHIEHEYRSGNISPKEANLALSAVVRKYVNEYTGLEAPVLSLDDLREKNVRPELIDAIARHYYPGSFRRDRTVDPIAGAQAARLVVSTWH